MVSYYTIVQNAYRITRQHAVLWVFGLFLISSLSLMLLFLDIPQVSSSDIQLEFWRFEYRLLESPLLLLGVFAGTIVLGIAAMAAVNCSRISLITYIHKVTETKYPPEFGELVADSRRFFYPVSLVSFFTTLTLVVVALGLLLPPFFLVHNTALQTLLWLLALTVFLPVAMTIVSINIFTSYYVVVFRQTVPRALNQATDFFVAHWTSILGMLAVMAAVYVVVYFVGVSFLYAFRTLGLELYGIVAGWNGETVSLVRTALQTMSGLGLWFMLAFLNAFFQTALLLLFFELNTPIKFEEPEKVRKLMPSSASTGT